MTLVTCSECGRQVSSRAQHCAGCRAPLASASHAPPGSTQNPAVSAAAPQPQAVKRFWRASLVDFAREGMAKETSLGRRLWIWFALCALLLYFVLYFTRVI